MSSAIDFASRLLALLDAARATTTYKYALLLAIIEQCQEDSGRLDGPVGSVTTRQLAEGVIDLYWPQTRVHSSGGGILRQLPRKQRSIPNLIVELRDRLGGVQTNAHRARLQDPSAFEDLVDAVEWILIRFPIPLLQKLGTETVPLIYDCQWSAQPPKRPVAVYQRALRTDRPLVQRGFDNMLRFFPGVEENLVALASLFRPLIKREWARFVAHCNQGLLEDVEDFLFEPTREDLTGLRNPLLQLQSGRCFYCHQTAGSKAHVDHFLPWSRCGDNHIGNLVVADSQCNGSKRDHLAALPHLQAWFDRLKRRKSELVCIAQKTAWPVDPDRSLRLARSLYAQVSPSTPLWLRKGKFVTADFHTAQFILS